LEILPELQGETEPEFSFLTVKILTRLQNFLRIKKNKEK